MTRVPTDRLATVTGIALAAAIAAWWLGSTRLALDAAVSPARFAADALQALVLARGIAVAIVAVRVGARRGPMPGIAASLAVIAPAWPLAVLAWEASAIALAREIAAESTLIVAAVALPLVGVPLRRSLRRGGLAVVAGTGVAAALAASIWLSRGLCCSP
jgi:hypothetical protein